MYNKFADTITSICLPKPCLAAKKYEWVLRCWQINCIVLKYSVL